MKNVLIKSDPVEVLTRIVQEIEKVSGDIRSQISQFDTQTKATLGHKLWAVSRKTLPSLDLIKTYLRDEAVQHQKGVPGTVQFYTSDGSSCSVSLPHPSLEVRKDADIESIRKILGPRFECFFKTNVIYKPREDFSEQIKSLDPATQQALLGIIDIVPNTPKVFFGD